MILAFSSAAPNSLERALDAEVAGLLVWKKIQVLYNCTTLPFKSPELHGGELGGRAIIIVIAIVKSRKMGYKTATTLRESPQ